jgi:hypothetical protein
MILRFLQLLTATLLLAACATSSPPPPPDPAFVALGLRTVAIGPVAYTTYQPGEVCSAFIDEDLRSAVARELRRRGYEVVIVGDSVPRSFAGGTPSPLPGNTELPAGTQGMLEVWIEEYFENTLCGWEGPKYLTMGAGGVLYAGTPPVEVWRSRARSAEQGSYTPRELIWLTTSRLADQLLGSMPAGPAWTGQR